MRDRPRVFPAARTRTARTPRPWVRSRVRAGLLARRSPFWPAFPALERQWRVQPKLTAYSCGGSAGIQPASLLATEPLGTRWNLDTTYGVFAASSVNTLSTETSQAVRAWAVLSVHRVTESTSATSTRHSHAPLHNTRLIHQGLTVVSGECATVGLAGGFTQGGGHSALSTSFGLGADQTLSFEVPIPSLTCSKRSS